jgi:hypothetical protein
MPIRKGVGSAVELSVDATSMCATGSPSAAPIHSSEQDQGRQEGQQQENVQQQQRQQGREKEQLQENGIPMQGDKRQQQLQDWEQQGKQQQQGQEHGDKQQRQCQQQQQQQQQEAQTPPWPAAKQVQHDSLQNSMCFNLNLLPWHKVSLCVSVCVCAFISTTCCV